MNHRIRNFDALRTTPLRRDALSIAEAAYAAIDTETILRAKLSIAGTTLSVPGAAYNLSRYKRIRVVGFGKVSCKAAGVIEAILEERVSDGIVIDVRPGLCDVVEVVAGTHPRPSPHNVAIAERIVAMAKDARKDDLYIVIVSGGGSALLCWPLDECTQGARLYDDMLGTGASIEEMNLIRKHLSLVKGGGLAAMLHPAEVLALVFCDIPGDRCEEVASGPTYFDGTTEGQARAALEKYGLSGYTLRETPKDTRLFERVRNIPVVSNTTALEAMTKAARALGYEVKNAGVSLYDPPHALIERMYALLGAKTAVLGGGETSITVTSAGKKGGRCQYLALEALQRMKDNELFLAFASDGIDNTDAGGALADAEMRAKVAAAGLSIEARLGDYDTYPFFEAAGGLLFTGITDANVSDLFVMLRS